MQIPKQTTAQETSQREHSTKAEVILEATHLKKNFPLKSKNPFRPAPVVHAVEDVSLQLLAGRATAVVGESGSGKTTVARMLAGIYTPTSGEIRFKSQIVNTSKEREMHAYRGNVQMIFQDPFASLNPLHTIYYHLSRALRLHGHVKSAEQEQQAIHSLLERVSLTPADQFMNKHPHQLSGGQRQRVAIARALAVQPKVLLADEPVSMLDVSIRLGVLNLLLDLKDEEHLAVLFITHDIASALYFAEDTMVMYAGQLVEGGASEEVIQRPLHPYTQLLISAAPDPDRMQGSLDEETTLDTNDNTKGEPPSLLHPPMGCRFHTRCPHVMPQCKQQFPPRSMVRPGHWTHCFLYHNSVS